MNYRTFLIITGFILVFVLVNCKHQNENKKETVNPVSGEIKSSGPAADVSIQEAALNGQMNQVMKLLGEGADVNMKDEDGRTALMYAAYNGHVEVIKKLIEKGALVNQRDNYGRTALMMASSGPYPQAAKLLLDNYADPNLADKAEQFTPLMYAAAEGHLEVVKILLAYRADPLLKDIDGDNAQTFASRNGHNEVAALLQSLKN